MTVNEQQIQQLLALQVTLVHEKGGKTVLEGIVVETPALEERTKYCIVHWSQKEPMYSGLYPDKIKIDSSSDDSVKIVAEVYGGGTYHDAEEKKIASLILGQHHL